MKKLLSVGLMAVLILTFVVAGCSGGGTEDPPIVSSEIYAGKTTVSGGEVFGTLLKSTDGGDTFTVLNDLTVDFSNNISRIFQIVVADDTIYLATNVGLAVSTDQGVSFDWFLQDDSVRAVYVSGNTIYAGVIGHVGSNRLAVSHDGGQSWTDLLVSYEINTIHGSGNTVCVATTDGLAVSTDSGANFTVYTHSASPDSLADNTVNGVWVSDGLIYAATNNGLSISDDNGVTFGTERDGDRIFRVAASGSNVYYTDGYELSVSDDYGDSYNSKTLSDLLVSTFVTGIYLSGDRVYVTGNTNASVSYDNGGTFTSVSGLNGLQATSLFVK